MMSDTPSQTWHKHTFARALNVSPSRTRIRVNFQPRQSSSDGSSISDKEFSSQSTTAGLQEDMSTAGMRTAIFTRSFDQTELDLMVRDIVASEALEGNSVSHDEARRAISQALNRPIVEIF
jgi:hypothetical protein